MYIVLQAFTTIYNSFLRGGQASFFSLSRFCANEQSNGISAIVKTQNKEPRERKIAGIDAIRRQVQGLTAGKKEIYLREKCDF